MVLKNGQTDFERLQVTGIYTIIYINLGRIYTIIYIDLARFYCKLTQILMKRLYMYVEKQHKAIYTSA